MILKRRDDCASFEIGDKSDSETKQLVLSYDKRNHYWTEKFRGKVVGSVIDTGDDLKLCVDNKFITLDYSQAEILFLLLKESCGLKTSNYEKWKRVK